MALLASCPRCTSAISEESGAFVCPLHGHVSPLWRPHAVGYESFAEHVERAGDIPTYLPWPMSPGWSIADFGSVSGHGRATVTSTAGTSAPDGEVDMTIILEDPGVGLGARCARTSYDDPGDQIANSQPAIHVRIEGRAIPLWSVESSADDEPLARSVFAGEAAGRWLWLIARPASAALLLRDDWLLADVAGFGPEALEMPFGGPRPAW